MRKAKSKERKDKNSILGSAGKDEISSVAVCMCIYPSSYIRQGVLGNCLIYVVNR